MDLAIRLADCAQAAAEGVGPYLRSAFAQRTTVSLKADFHDPVTEHDLAAQTAIVRTLFEAFPVSLIVGEEASELIARDGTPREPTDADVVWYVDPIDGTSNFAAGFDHWCVSIAAAQAGRLLAGVIYQPTQGILYRADSTGAYKNGERLTALTVPAREGIIATEFPSPRIRDLEVAFAGFHRVLKGARSVRRPGSTALMLAEVAAGHFVAAFNVGTHPWDVAAGALLVERAGGQYIGWDTEGYMARDAVLAPNFVASGSPDAAALCLGAAGHPDPESVIRAVFREPEAAR